MTTEVIESDWYTFRELQPDALQRLHQRAQAQSQCPDRKVRAIMGDGSFLMNSQALETTMREKIYFVVLI